MLERLLVERKNLYVKDPNIQRERQQENSLTKSVSCRIRRNKSSPTILISKIIKD